MKKFILIFLSFFACFLLNSVLLAETTNIVSHLKEGNERFVKGIMTHPHQNTQRRKATAASQSPEAIILSCSDSRVPSEIIFDQGVGDLFVVRVAGNVLDDVNLGSIEYAIEHLGVKDIVVLGHSRCGAITAAVKGGKFHGHVGSIISRLKPAVKEARKKCNACDMVEEAGHINVSRIATELRSRYDVNVVGAYYDLATGRVEFLDK